MLDGVGRHPSCSHGPHPIIVSLLGGKEWSPNAQRPQSSLDTWKKAPGGQIEQAAAHASEFLPSWLWVSMNTRNARTISIAWVAVGKTGPNARS